LFEYRVTKYDPANRDAQGAYTREEWSAVSDIGHAFAGVVLTEPEYQRVEDAYVLAALAFLQETGVLSLTIAGLENHAEHPLPFSDGAFDDVVASLVLHYLEDWGPTLAELRRVLTPGGRLIVSIDHPFAIHAIQRAAGRKPNYYATYKWTEEWTLGGQTVQMSFWHRPLHATTDAFTAAGFRISVISEPQPVPAARELFPDEFPILTTNPDFLFFVLHAD